MEYGHALVGGASHPATFVRVYDICGPTYPGEYDAGSGAYTLHYPGLALWFPIPPAHAQRCSESQVGTQTADGSLANGGGQQQKREQKSHSVAVQQSRLP